MRAGAGAQLQAGTALGYRSLCVCVGGGEDEVVV